MVSTFTPNVQIEEPARGDYVGTWDTPVNANMTLIDLILGGRTTISGAAGSVVLAAAQYQCKTITINSTLLASITLTFPTSFTKSYEVQNICTGTSAFYVVLGTTVAGGEVVCCPPGEIFEIINDGTNIRFKNFGRIGSYWDYSGSSVPAWVSNCTVPPYLNCNAGTFSSATYPQLATILGSTTLPDHRGRARFALDQGAGRISSAATGFSGSSVGSGGGAQAVTLATSQIPAHTHGVTDAGHSHPLVASAPGGVNQLTVTAGSGVNVAVPQTTSLAVTGITIDNAGGGGDHTNLPPALIGGITMIRAA